MKITSKIKAIGKNLKRKNDKEKYAVIKFKMRSLEELKSMEVKKGEEHIN